MLPLAGFPFPIILLIISSALSSTASSFGAICTPPTSPSNSTLYQDSCNSSMLSCDPDTKSCQWRSCTILGITLGWDNATHPPPALCNSTSFCPNSQLGCLPLLSLGLPCDMGRDDECAGSHVICLNSVCTSKSANLGAFCSTESISNGWPSINTVRDNCTAGTYCSALNGIGICQNALSGGQGCIQDRQCASQQCQNGHCTENGSSNSTLPAWQWAIIGVILFICLVTVIGILVVIRSRRSDQDLGELYYDDPAPSGSYQKQQLWWRRSRDKENVNALSMHEQEKPVVEALPYWHANTTSESYDTAITLTPSAFPIPPRRSPAPWKHNRNIASKAINKVNIRLSGTFTPTFGGSSHRKSKSPISPIPSPANVYTVVDEEQELKIWQPVRGETPPWPVQGKGWKFARGNK